MAEARRIASRKLTLLKFANYDSGLKVPSRKREHDPDKAHLLDDKIKLGFDKDTPSEALSKFTDDYIREHLRLGYDEAIQGVCTFEGTSSLIHQDWSLVCDHKYLAYTNMAVEALHRNIDDDSHDDEDGNVDHDCNDHDNDDIHNHDDVNDDDDIGMDLDEHRSVIPARSDRAQSLPPSEMLVDVDPKETFQPTETEEDDAIAETIDLISELDDNDTGDNSDHNNDTRKPTVWHVRDGSGGWTDSRKVVALLNQNSGAWKLSKDRVTKIIQSFGSAGKTNGTAAYGAVEELGDVVQSVGLNSIASFCFEDAAIKGGLRFWLGKVLRMVHRPKTGSKKVLTSRIALKDIPADLYLSCTWFTPILTNGATELTAKNYELLPQVVSDLTKEVDAKYIISVVEMQ